jgi:hypothetical protein
MGQVIDKFFALNNQQPEQFSAILANRERLIDQAGRLQRKSREEINKRP